MIRERSNHLSIRNHTTRHTHRAPYKLNLKFRFIIKAKDHPGYKLRLRLSEGLSIQIVSEYDQKIPQLQTAD